MTRRLLNQVYRCQARMRGRINVERRPAHVGWLAFLIHVVVPVVLTGGMRQ